MGILDRFGPIANPHRNPHTCPTSASGETRREAGLQFLPTEHQASSVRKSRRSAGSRNCKNSALAVKAASVFSSGAMGYRDHGTKDFVE